tara:strand:- start:323 stop:892 length:570 start_codon:yes stop_codon:yes gene_type:complete
MRTLNNTLMALTLPLLINSCTFDEVKKPQEGVKPPTQGFNTEIPLLSYKIKERDDLRQILQSELDGSPFRRTNPKSPKKLGYPYFSIEGDFSVHGNGNRHLVQDFEKILEAANWKMNPKPFSIYQDNTWDEIRHIQKIHPGRKINIPDLNKDGWINGQRGKRVGTVHLKARRDGSGLISKYNHVKYGGN